MRRTRKIFEDAIENNKSDDEIDQLLDPQALLGAIIHYDYDFENDLEAVEFSNLILKTHDLFLNNLPSYNVKVWYIPFVLKNNIHVPMG